jgi:hypothetical protein
MRVRDRVLPCLTAAVVLALAVGHVASGVGADALIAVPALLLLVPLVAGRYVGAERLVRLVRRSPRPRYGRARPVLRRPPVRRAGPRGGLLIAVALARRGPPASAGAR